jgi:proteic killer suppression protein
MILMLYCLRMIASFHDQGTEDVYNGIDSRLARKACPVGLWRLAARKLDLLDAAVIPADLRIPPGNRLEALTGNRKGQYSIRINDQYRLCFSWTPRGAEHVEIVDYH